MCAVSNTFRRVRTDMVPRWLLRLGCLGTASSSGVVALLTDESLW